jgi:hypothetical protein
MKAYVVCEEGLEQHLLISFKAPAIEKVMQFLRSLRETADVVLRWLEVVVTIGRMRLVLM